MDAVKFIQERNRMCKSFDAGCKGCPAFNACEDELCCAVGQESTLDAKAQIAMVEEWSAAHPRKTRQSVFLEQYPGAKIDSITGVPSVYPCAIEQGMENTIYCNSISCADCRREFWTQEVE